MVRKVLSKTLFDFKLYQDTELFEKAYGYVSTYRLVKRKRSGCQLYIETTCPPCYHNLMNNYLERIPHNPIICGGQPVIRGTRVPVKTILASLSEGSTIGETLTSFPTVTEADVWAVVALKVSH